MRSTRHVVGSYPFMSSIGYMRQLTPCKKDPSVDPCMTSHNLPTVYRKPTVPVIPMSVSSDSACPSDRSYYAVNISRGGAGDRGDRDDQSINSAGIVLNDKKRLGYAKAIELLEQTEPSKYSRGVIGSPEDGDIFIFDIDQLKNENDYKIDSTGQWTGGQVNLLPKENKRGIPPLAKVTSHNKSKANIQPTKSFKRQTVIPIDSESQPPIHRRINGKRLVLIQYTGDADAVIHRPHGNSKDKINGQSYVRTCPSVFDNIKEATLRYERPQGVYDEHMNTVKADNDIRKHVIPKNRKQCENHAQSARNNNKLSPDEIYSVVMLHYTYLAPPLLRKPITPHDTESFILHYKLVPTVEIVVCLPEVAVMFTDMINCLYNNDTSDMNEDWVSLQCDTTYEMGDFYVTTLSFTHKFFTTENNTRPNIPLAFLMHDRKYQHVHESFLNAVKHRIPVLSNVKVNVNGRSKYKYKFFVTTDREKSIHNSFAICLQSFLRLYCWNHIKNDGKRWVQKNLGKSNNRQDTIRFYVKLITAFLSCDSREEFDEMYAEKFLTVDEGGVVDPKFKEYFDTYMKNDIIDYAAKWIVEGTNYYLPTSGITTNNQEGLNAAIKRGNNKEKFGLLDKPLQIMVLNYLQRYYYNLYLTAMTGQPCVWKLRENCQVFQMDIDSVSFLTDVPKPDKVIDHVISISRQFVYEQCEADVPPLPRAPQVNVSNEEPNVRYEPPRSQSQQSNEHESCPVEGGVPKTESGSSQESQVQSDKTSDDAFNPSTVLVIARKILEEDKIHLVPKLGKFAVQPHNESAPPYWVSLHPENCTCKFGKPCAHILAAKLCTGQEITGVKHNNKVLRIDKLIRQNKSKSDKGRAGKKRPRPLDCDETVTAVNDHDYDQNLPTTPMSVNIKRTPSHSRQKSNQKPLTSCLKSKPTGNSTGSTYRKNLRFDHNTPVKSEIENVISTPESPVEIVETVQLEAEWVRIEGGNFYSTLKYKDRHDIAIEGRWVEDDVANFAMYLMKRDIGGDIGGLTDIGQRPTLRTAVDGAGEQIAVDSRPIENWSYGIHFQKAPLNKKTVQIHHIINHYVTSMRMADDKTVYVLDSNNSKHLCTTLKMQLVKMYKIEGEDILNVTMFSSQPQSTGNCIQFAIANCYDFITTSRVKWNRLMFDEPAMRNHIIACFETHKEMRPFPTSISSQGQFAAERKFFKINVPKYDVVTERHVIGMEDFTRDDSHVDSADAGMPDIDRMVSKRKRTDSHISEHTPKKVKHDQSEHVRDSSDIKPDTSSISSVPQQKSGLRNDHQTPVTNRPLPQQNTDSDNYSKSPLFHNDIKTHSKSPGENVDYSDFCQSSENACKGLQYWCNRLNSTDESVSFQPISDKYTLVCPVDKNSTVVHQTDIDHFCVSKRFARDKETVYIFDHRPLHKVRGDVVLQSHLRSHYRYMSKINVHLIKTSSPTNCNKQTPTKATIPSQMISLATAIRVKSYINDKCISGKLEFDMKRMSSHFLSCYHSGVVVGLFPEAKPSLVRNNDVVFNPTRFVIRRENGVVCCLREGVTVCCDTCDTWHHYGPDMSCADLDQTPISDKSFHCRKCVNVMSPAY